MIITLIILSLLWLLVYVILPRLFQDWINKLVTENEIKKFNEYNEE